MNRRKSKRIVSQFQNNVKNAGKKVDHFSRILEGFNFLIEKKAVVIDLPAVYLYRELLGSKKSEQEAWVKNAYLYARIKLDHAEGTMLVFYDIETKDIIGRFDGVKYLTF